MKSKNLVTGSSGLCSFLSEKLNSIKIHRTKNTYTFDNSAIKIEKIIHCGFGKIDSLNDESSFIEQQINYISELLKLNFRKFVFISTIDIFGINKDSTYAKTKKILEDYLKENCCNYLIIRPSLLIGDGMKINNVLKIAFNSQTPLTLSKDSSFSLIWYEDVLSVINSNATGEYNLTSGELIKLEDVASFFSVQPKWGDFRYETPKIYPTDRSFEMTKNLQLKKLHFFLENNSYL